ncbi:hypothetical protein [Cyclobacterium marinum]|uniref:Small multi-drug export protein n=1 Tax=Cyclobacterium marinum (strain ATCC 25205 / DSM 745 / LMG 13164 / NCIMB 1802) TaxID=880070 RepID=G0IVT1_CYCMS|nr:hypothetical protein [Cyclobacterium marinum]AEL24848.1 hypothetical protein Cycma_1076 [Cyclobacterium marinum DSM 745]MBI0401676.1 hypothetical protein [Cyclobacterium marinum]MBR9775969.1 hypothetical protein [Cytophagales bacterium]|tara:strand:- start:34017 stop:34475 length:459 start_codon:yes stop_codon:yes gene_type:complete
MSEYLIKFAGIYFLCLFKFIAGPLLGAAAGYSLIEIILVTVLGMMTSVFLFTFLGEWFKKNWTIIIKKKSKKFSKRTRNTIKVWKKFGVWGIAFLTPLILTPIGGTVVLTSFGVAKKKILFSMFISALFWAFVFGLSIEELLKIPLLRDLWA